VDDRHLLPSEIDLLLDDDSGAGAAPLKVHVGGCAACAAALEEARFVAEMLTTAPHLKPQVDFSEKVMGRVKVVEPWHATAFATVRSFLPAPGPARVMLGAMAVTAGLVTTAAAVWVALRADSARMIGTLAFDGAGRAVMSAFTTLVGDTFGPEAVAALRGKGMIGLAVALPAFALVAAGAFAGFRALAVASNARRPRNA
jgi:hypothetical protein